MATSSWWNGTWTTPGVERTRLRPAQTVDRSRRQVISNPSSIPIRRELRVVFHDDEGATGSVTWDLVVGGSRLSDPCPRIRFNTQAEVTVSQVSPEQLSARAGSDVLVSFAKTTHVHRDTSFYEKISLVNADGEEVASTGSFTSIPRLVLTGGQFFSHEYGPDVYSITIPLDTETSPYTVRGYIFSEDLSTECHRLNAEASLVVRPGSAFGEESGVRGHPNVIPPLAWPAAHPV